MEAAAHKKHRKQYYTGMNFPEDMLMEILLNLPVKSLLRFSCVCKAWRDLLRTSSFADNHVQNYYHHKNDDPVVFLRRWYSLMYHNSSYDTPKVFKPWTDRRRNLHDYGKDARYYEDLLITHRNHDDSLPVVSRLRDKLGRLPHDIRLRLFGSCNGILCLSEAAQGQLDRHPIVHLCNPITGEYLVLPRGLSRPGEFRFSSSTLGFGFDLVSNDYKVIWVAMGVKFFAAEIYKLSINCWTKLDMGAAKTHNILSFNNERENRHGLLMNGVLHWWCWRRSTLPLEAGMNGGLILTFDLQTEKFERIKCPPGQKGFREKGAVVGLLEDCLAFICCGNDFDVWMMREYGNEESWTKKFSLRPLFPWAELGSYMYNSIIGFWNGIDKKVELLKYTGELIALQGKANDVVVNIEKAIKFKLSCSRVEAVIFQPSLVSLSKNCTYQIYEF